MLTKIVKRDATERADRDRLMGAHHYLGFRSLFGGGDPAPLIEGPGRLRNHIRRSLHGSTDMNTLVNKTLVAVAAALFLSACGGGGGGGNPVASNDPAPPAPAPAPAPTPAPDPTPGPEDAELRAGEELATAMANGNLPLPSEHGIPSGRIEIAARAYQDRNGFRFSCTGAEACVVAIDAAGGQARVVAGNVRLARLAPAPTPTPVATPTPAPTPTPEPEPTPALIQLPVDHEMVDGSEGSIDPGRTRNRDHVRFTCAAGGDVCRYTYVGGGRIRATGGTLSVAAVPWPDYVIMDVARLQSLLGGSALDWGSDQTLSEVRTRLLPRRDENGNLQHRFGPSGSSERLEADAFTGYSDGATILDYDTDGNLRVPGFGGYYGDHQQGRLWLDSDNRWSKADAVITGEHGIAYVQAVSKGETYPDPRTGDDYPQSTYVLGGLLDYADFWISEAIDPVIESDGPQHGAFYRIYDRYGDDNSGEPLRDPIRATWRGSLIGIGHNKAYPDLYRQLIAGDVEITTDFAMRQPYDIVTADVTFSDIKKVDTGEAVTLSTQNWQLESHRGRTYLWPDAFADGSGVGIEWGPGEDDVIALEFGGLNYSTAAGVFITREALGAFGAEQ